MPWTTYEYSLTVTNRAGTQTTNYQPIRTAQAVPEGLAPPTVTVSEGELHVIDLTGSHHSILTGIYYSIHCGELLEVIQLKYTEVSNEHSVTCGCCLLFGRKNRFLSKNCRMENIIVIFIN